MRMEDLSLAHPEVEDENTPVEFQIRKKKSDGMLSRIYALVMGDAKKRKRRLSLRNKSYITTENYDLNNNIMDTQEHSRMQQQRGYFRSSFIAPPPAFNPPPMPYFGHTADIKVLIERNKKARKIMSEVMTTVSADISSSIDRAQHVPVASAGDRVVVTTDVYDMIAASRSKKDIVLNYRANLSKIEACLLHRQMILEMMNTNIDQVQVASNAPVDMQNARGITITK
jgi:hypothetical protein